MNPEYADPSPQWAGRPRRNRPLRAISSLILALAAAVAVHLEGVPLRVTTARQAASLQLRPSFSIGIGHLVTIGGTAAFLVFALISAFAFARWTRSVLERFIGVAYGAMVRYVLILLGIAVVLLVTLSMLGFQVGQLVVGGAVTGVLLTIAAQQSLSNVFAGVMLQLARPFKVGDLVRIRAGTLGGVIEGMVVEFTITYVRLETDDGPMLLPNAQVQAAAVSPLRAVPAKAAAGTTTATGVHLAGDPAAHPGVAAIAEGIATLATEMAAGHAQSAQPQTAAPHGAERQDEQAPNARPQSAQGSAAGQS